MAEFRTYVWDSLWNWTGIMVAALGLVQLVEFLTGWRIPALSWKVKAALVLIVLEWAQFTAYTSKTQELSKTLAQLRDTPSVQPLQERIADLARQLAEKDRIIEDKNRDLAARQTETQQLKDTLDQLRGRVSDLQRQLEDRESRQKKRIQLAAYARDGRNLRMRAQSGSAAAPLDDATNWGRSVTEFVATDLGRDYAERFNSDAGLPPIGPINSPSKDHERVWIYLNNRLTRLDEFMRELAR